MNTPPNRLMGLLTPPPVTLAEFVQKHYDEKVIHKACELCNNIDWVMMVGDDKNDFMVLKGPESLKESMGWPAMGWVCTNCHHIRWMAIQPLINAWNRLRAGGAQ